MLEILQWSIPVEKTQSPPLIDLFFPQTSPFFCTIHAFDEISWVLNEFRVMVSQFKGDMCAKFPRKRTPRQCYLTKAAVDHFTWKLQQNLALISLDFLVLAFSTPSHKESQLCDSKNSAFLLELAALFLASMKGVCCASCHEKVRQKSMISWTSGQGNYTASSTFRNSIFFNSCPPWLAYFFLCISLEIGHLLAACEYCGQLSWLRVFS